MAARSIHHIDLYTHCARLDVRIQHKVSFLLMNGSVNTHMTVQAKFPV